MRHHSDPDLNELDHSDLRDGVSASSTTEGPIQHPVSVIFSPPHSQIKRQSRVGLRGMQVSKEHVQSFNGFDSVLTARVC